MFKTVPMSKVEQDLIDHQARPRRSVPLNPISMTLDLWDIVPDKSVEIPPQLMARTELHYLFDCANALAQF